MLANVKLVEGQILVETKPLTLTAYEFRVLQCLLLAGAGAVRSKDELAVAVYGDGRRPASSNVLEVLVGRVRKALRVAGARVDIETLRRRGYVLAVAA